jgi:hypothetical protein
MKDPSKLHVRSLRGVIITLILVVVGTTALVTAVLLSIASERMLGQAVEARSRLIATITLRGIRDAMLRGESARLRSVLERVRGVESISNIRIVDPSGTVRFDAARRDSGERLVISDFTPRENSAGFQFAYRDSAGRRVLESLLPIQAETPCMQCHRTGGLIAYLNVETDTQEITQLISDYRALLVSSLTLTLIGIGVVLGFVLTVRVTTPLRQLAERIRRTAGRVGALAHGDEVEEFPPVAVDGATHEIARLADSFNALVAALEESHREVRRLHQHEMERASKMASIGELASSIAHEIRNPLTGILGAVEVIGNDLPPDSPKRQVIEMIRAEVLRLNRTLSNLLSFARPQPLDFRRADINDIVEKTLEFVRRRATEQNVHIAVSLDRSAPPVLADTDGLTQVLINVLINALDAMADGGRVSVSVVSMPSGAEVRIQDGGPGMSRSTLASLFKPFFTTKSKGTGLGLAISKRIIDAHGGRLEITSRPGLGTTVAVYIPSAGARETPLPTSAAGSHQPGENDVSMESNEKHDGGLPG